MLVYPIHLRLEGSGALVAGGGAVAHRKVAGLLLAGAIVTVVAPRLVAPLLALKEARRITWLEQHITPALFKAAPIYKLVFCATDDREVNAAIGKAARKAGALVNDATAPELCDFFLPSAIRLGDLLVTVATGGISPALSRALKKRLAAHLGKNWSDWLKRLARLRRKVKEHIKESRQREMFWRTVFSKQLLDLVEEGKLNEAEAEIRYALDCFGSKS